MYIAIAIALRSLLAIQGVFETQDQGPALPLRETEPLFHCPNRASISDFDNATTLIYLGSTCLPFDCLQLLPICFVHFLPSKLRGFLSHVSIST
jgi:hypothetical protein